MSKLLSLFTAIVSVLGTILFGVYSLRALEFNFVLAFVFFGCACLMWAMFRWSVKEIKEED
jgi:hypothetical protein